MKKIGLIVLGLMVVVLAKAQDQNGIIMGKVYQSDSTEVVPFAKVWIDYNGDILGVTTDINGRYKISAVKPGVYNLHADATLFGKASLTGLNVYSGGITKNDIYLSGTIMLTACPVGPDPILRLSSANIISQDDIKHNIQIQNPKEMINNLISDIQIDANDQMIIRGSRPGDVIYFVDGVKQRDLQTLPGVSINSISVYTSGVPAKYGDTMGGVVILNTKGYFDLYYAWKANQ